MSLVVGSLGSEALKHAVRVKVPCLTNARDLQKGEYLLMEVERKAPSKKRPADWKSDAERAAQEARRGQTTPKSKTKQKANCTSIGPDILQL